MRHIKIMIGLALALVVYIPNIYAQSTNVLITLGTGGGPLPRADRAQSSNLLLINNQPYLIDMGDGVTRRLAETGTSFMKVNQIFITHNHNDHMAGLATFLDTTWQYAKRTAIDVYGPVGTEAVVKGAIQYMTEDSQIRVTEGKVVPLTKVFVGHDMSEGLIYQDENVKVHAIQNSHFNLPGESAKLHQSFAYRFDTKNSCFTFTGDTGPSAAIEKLAKDCDVLVAEVGKVEEVIAVMEKNGTWQNRTKNEQQDWIKHMVDEHITPQQVGEMATRAGVKKLVLTHLLPTTIPKDDYERYKTEATQFFKGQIIVAKDLMRIEN
jgi:ribonuclease BN (tRNA processing enzyme)